jgi:uncharacterized membrane protein HdeD (DUF308 family)
VYLKSPADVSRVLCYHGAMLFFLSKRTQPYGQPQSPFGSSLPLLGTVSILFGLAIISAPELLVYLVAGFFIVTGIWLLGLWWRIRKFTR